MQSSQSKAPSASCRISSSTIRHTPKCSAKAHLRRSTEVKCSQHREDGGTSASDGACSKTATSPWLRTLGRSAPACGSAGSAGAAHMCHGAPSMPGSGPRSGCPGFPPSHARQKRSCAPRRSRQWGRPPCSAECHLPPAHLCPCPPLMPISASPYGDLRPR